jgi:hypothetical protein
LCHELATDLVAYKAPRLVALCQPFCCNSRESGAVRFPSPGLLLCQRRDETPATRRAQAGRLHGSDGDSACSREDQQHTHAEEPRRQADTGATSSGGVFALLVRAHAPSVWLAGHHRVRTDRQAIGPGDAGRPLCIAGHLRVRRTDRHEDCTPGPPGQGARRRCASAAAGIDSVGAQRAAIVLLPRRARGTLRAVVYLSASHRRVCLRCGGWWQGS